MAEKVVDQKVAVVAKAKSLLLKNAIWSIYYVADGNVLPRDLIEEFGVDENIAKWALANAVTDLVAKLEKLQ